MTGNQASVPKREQRGRSILSLRTTEERPRIGNLLAGVEHLFSTTELTEAQRWGEALCEAASQWEVEKRKGGGRYVR